MLADASILQSRLFWITRIRNRSHVELLGMAVAQTSKTADRPVLRVHGGLAVLLAGLLAITLWLGTATPLTAGILSPEDTSIYRRAFSSADKRKWRTALGLAGQAKDSVLREVVYWMYYRDRKSGAVFQDISRFMATHQSWPGMAGLKLAGEMAIDATVGDDAVLAWFAHHGRPNTLQGAERMAKALIQQGRPNEANGMLRRIWIELNFNLRDEKRFLARHSHLVNAAIHDARLERLLHDKQRKQIRRQIKRVTPEIRSLYRLRKNLRRNLPQSLRKIKLLPHRLRYHQGSAERPGRCLHGTQRIWQCARDHSQLTRAAGSTGRVGQAARLGRSIIATRQ